LLDAWQLPLVDVGPKGEDKGRGGKYLILPPDYQGDIPTGYIVVPASTFNGYGLFRVIPAAGRAEDLALAIKLIQRHRIYALADAEHPPEQRFIDMADKLFNGIVGYDETFYHRLSRMVNEELVQTRDLTMMGQLRSLGIEKGKEFKPGLKIKLLLTKAIKQAYEQVIAQFMDNEPWWLTTHWGLPKLVRTAFRTDFQFQTSDFLDIDGRGTHYFLACAPPRRLAAASFYLVTTYDASGYPLYGWYSYWLRIPPKVPAEQCWAVSIYNLETAGFISDSLSVGVDAYKKNLQKNGDGSIDIFFSPTAPAGRETNWIHTAQDKRWFARFDFYGPEKGILDKTWRMADIDQIR
jgi:hypothetical protein